MKHKFENKKKEYLLRRGEFIYIPSNLKKYLPEYCVNTAKSLGCAYIKVNGKIEKIPCGVSISIKKEGNSFKMAYDLFLDDTEDEVRFDID